MSDTFSGLSRWRWQFARISSLGLSLSGTPHKVEGCQAWRRVGCHAWLWRTYFARLALASSWTHCSIDDLHRTTSWRPILDRGSWQRLTGGQGCDFECMKTDHGSGVEAPQRRIINSRCPRDVHGRSLFSTTLNELSGVKYARVAKRFLGELCCTGNNGVACVCMEYWYLNSNLTCLKTRLHHTPQKSHDLFIFKRRRNTLLVCQLLIELIRCIVCAFLYLHFDSIARR